MSHQNFDSREQDLRGLLTRAAADIPADADLSGPILRRLADSPGRAPRLFARAGALHRHAGATLSAALVVALIAASLILLRPSPAGYHLGGPLLRPSAPATGPGPAAVPATPVATMGPGAAHITSVVTATGVDAQLNPTGLTSHFVVNSDVYVVMGTRQIPQGEKHTVSIRWFLQGIDIQLPPTAGTGITVSGDRQVFFSLVYPQPGVGMAKVYFDRPVNDKGDDPKDPALAATIYFAVEMPTPKGGSPTVSSGPDKITIADVSNKTEQDALATLRLAGFTNVTPQHQISATVAAGIVIGTDPPAGTSVLPGAAITLIVSSGSGASPSS